MMQFTKMKLKIVFGENCCGESQCVEGKYKTDIYDLVEVF